MGIRHWFRARSASPANEFVSSLPEQLVAAPLTEKATGWQGGPASAGIASWAEFWNRRADFELEAGPLDRQAFEEAFDDRAQWLVKAFELLPPIAPGERREQPRAELWAVLLRQPLTLRSLDRGVTSILDAVFWPAVPGSHFSQVQNAFQRLVPELAVTVSAEDPAEVAAEESPAAPEETWAGFWALRSDADLLDPEQVQAFETAVESQAEWLVSLIAAVPGGSEPTMEVVLTAMRAKLVSAKIEDSSITAAAANVISREFWPRFPAEEADKARALYERFSGARPSTSLAAPSASQISESIVLKNALDKTEGISAGGVAGNVWRKLAADFDLDPADRSKQVETMIQAVEEFTIEHPDHGHAAIERWLTDRMARIVADEQRRIRVNAARGRPEPGRTSLWQASTSKQDCQCPGCVLSKSRTGDVSMDVKLQLLHAQQHVEQRLRAVLHEDVPRKYVDILQPALLAQYSFAQNPEHTHCWRKREDSLRVLVGDIFDATSPHPESDYVTALTSYVEAALERLNARSGSR